jgi:hypothetical protein
VKSGKAWTKRWRFFISRAMKVTELIDKIRDLRNSQKDFFRLRLIKCLKESKKLEGDIDDITLRPSAYFKDNIRVYVARDIDGSLWLFDECRFNEPIMEIPDDTLFPDIKFEDGFKPIKLIRYE